MTMVKLKPTLPVTSEVNGVGIKMPKDLNKLLHIRFWCFWDNQNLLVNSTLEPECKNLNTELNYVKQAS